MLNKTFDEWKAAGYHVIKGQKATGRNESDKATFTRKQVESSRQEEYDNADYEDDWFWRDVYDLDD